MILSKYGPKTKCVKLGTIHLTLSMSERTQIKTDKHVFFLDSTTLSKLIHIKIGSLHEIHPCTGLSLDPFFTTANCKLHLRFLKNAKISKQILF